MKKNECMDAAVGVLSDAGITDVVRSYGGKHLQLRWTTPNGEPRLYSMAATPSDHRRAARNVRADVRRMLRQDGMLAVEEPRRAPDERQRIEARIATHERKLANLRRLLTGGETYRP